MRWGPRRVPQQPVVAAPCRRSVPSAAGFADARCSTAAAPLCLPPSPLPPPALATSRWPRFVPHAPLYCSSARVRSSKLVGNNSLVVSQRAARRVTSSEHASIRDCIAKGLHLQKVSTLSGKHVLPASQTHRDLPTHSRSTSQPAITHALASATVQFTLVLCSPAEG